MRKINKRFKNYKNKAQLKKEKNLKKILNSNVTMPEIKYLLVGVYCKLQRNGDYDHKLKNCMYIGSFETEPLYKICDLGCDAGILENGNTSVKIEIYQMSKEQLMQLDNFKSCNLHTKEYNLFERKSINSPFGEIEVYFSLYNPEEEDNTFNFSEYITGNVLEYYQNKQNKTLNN